ncbi:MAG: hypothetical protein KDD33_04665 [Bdellovibrionales bacterium]|nr:hypothetical protein [Bdellovibrionales bacterium]
MSYEVYKLLHLFGIFLLIISLSGIASHILQGGTKGNFKNRKFFGALHGTGLTISLIAGFGLIARRGFEMTSGWILGKLLFWLILGAFPVIFYRQNSTSKNSLYAMIAILVAMLYLVEYKPF